MGLVDQSPDGITKQVDFNNFIYEVQETEVNAVPTPSGIVLFGTGLGALALTRAKSAAAKAKGPWQVKAAAATAAIMSVLVPATAQAKDIKENGPVVEFSTADSL